MSNINYCKIEKASLEYGSGIRVVLWCSDSITDYSKNSNEESHSLMRTKFFDQSAENELFTALNKPNIKGLTLIGGNPLKEENLYDIWYIVHKFKRIFQDKDIWLYTEYIWEQLYIRAVLSITTDDKLLRDILNTINVLVDGPFILKNYDLNSKWRISNNQRIIDISNTLEHNNIIEIK